MANTLSRMRVAVLGAGKIGGILLQGFIKHHLISRDRATAMSKVLEKVSGSTRPKVATSP